MVFSLYKGGWTVSMRALNVGFRYAICDGGFHYNAFTVFQKVRDTLYELLE